MVKVVAEMKLKAQSLYHHGDGYVYTRTCVLCACTIDIPYVLYNNVHTCTPVYVQGTHTFHLYVHHVHVICAPPACIV